MPSLCAPALHRLCTKPQDPTLGRTKPPMEWRCHRMAQSSDVPFSCKRPPLLCGGTSKPINYGGLVQECRTATPAKWTVCRGHFSCQVMTSICKIEEGMELTTQDYLSAAVTSRCWRCKKSTCRKLHYSCIFSWHQDTPPPVWHGHSKCRYSYRFRGDVA